MMRRGILRISIGMEERVQKALPAEHRIVATKGDPRNMLVEWLIEGPLMPEVPDGAEPPEVRIILTLHADRGISAIFEHAPDQGWQCEPLGPVLERNTE
jgi:hypothetical protein